MKKTNKNTGFKTPKGYFDGLSARLLSKMKLDEVTFSNTYNHRDGFKVPDGYFKDLNKNILLKVSQKETKVVSLYKNYYYYVASIAAVLVVVFAIEWNTNKASSFDSLLSADIENYFNENELDLLDNELAELLPMHDVEISDIINQGINEERIVEYLNNNIEDLHELNNVYDEE